MPVLQYDIAVTGIQNVNRAIDGVEKRLQRSNQRTMRRAGVSPNEARRSRAGAVAGLDPAARANERAILRQERLRQRGIEKAIRLQDQMHSRRMRDISREKAAEERAALKAAQARSRAISGRVGAIGRSVGGTLAGVGRFAGTALGLAGGALVTSAVSRRVREGNISAGLANRVAAVPGEKRSRQQLNQQIRGLSRSQEEISGRESGVILGGLDIFQEKTGEFDAAKVLIPKIVNLADAVGLADEDFRELSKASGIVYAGFRKQGLGTVEAMKQTEEAMSKLAAQSAVGQIGIPDLSAELPKLLQAAGRVGGDPAKALAAVTGFANISAAVASRGPEEAATAAVRFTDDLLKKVDKKGKLKGTNVQVLDEGGNIRDFTQLIPEIALETKGSLPELLDIFGNRGARIQEFAQKITRTSKTPEEAKKRISAEIAPFLNADFSKENMDQAAAFFRNTEEKRLAKSYRDLERAIADDFTPVLINDLLPALRDMAPHVKTLSSKFASFISFLANNPVEGIGIIIGGAIVKDIMGAGIGESVSRAISGSMGAGPGAGGGGGLLGAAGTGLIVGTITAAAITAGGISLFEGSEDRIDKAGEQLDFLRKTGDKEGLQKFASKTQSNAAEIESRDSLATALSFMIGPLGVAFDQLIRKPIDETEAASMRGLSEQATTEAGKGNEELKQAAAEQMRAAKAIADAAGRINSTGGPTTAPNRSDSPTSPG